MTNREIFEIDLVSPLLRAANTAIFAAVGAAQLLFSGERGVSLPGILIMVLTALGALIEERWVFDLAEETARFRFGLLFAAHIRTIRFADISGVEFEDFEKGFNRQSWTQIILRVPAGKDEIIDAVNRKKARKLIEKAERLAAFFKARNGG